MAHSGSWTIGVDLGATKTIVARVDGEGHIVNRILLSTNVKGGASSVISEIVDAIRELRGGEDSPPSGIGAGVAGQVERESGVVRFAPNLGWHNVPLQADLSSALKLPVVVTNDVRAATWGEWVHGAGRGSDDLICLFVGTGIGGGVVSGGTMLSGCSNTAGELGHMTIAIQGPPCHCGNIGCLEAHAGGWAIARRAQEAITKDPAAGAHMLKLANSAHDAVNAKIVARAAKENDPLALLIEEEIGQSLVAGSVSLVNAFNPCRLILGGGVIEGFPKLVERIAQGIRRYALKAASESLQVLPAQLHNDAGVIGAATLALKALGAKKRGKRTR